MDRRLALLHELKDNAGFQFFLSDIKAEKESILTDLNDEDLSDKQTNIRLGRQMQNGFILARLDQMINHYTLKADGSSTTT